MLSICAYNMLPSSGFEHWRNFLQLYVENNMAWSRASRLVTTTFLLLIAAGELPALEARLVGPADRCLGTDEAPASLSRPELGACGGAAEVRRRWSLPARGFSGEARLGGLCLDVDHSQTADLTPIQLFPCHGGANQRWQHDTLGRLVGLAGKCLDLSPGAGGAEGPAALFPCDSSAGQSFLAEPYEAWGSTHAQSAVDSAFLLPTSDPAIAYQVRGGYLQRTADGGRTWAPVSHFGGIYSISLAVEHQQPDRLWRITDQRKLWRSEDGGRSWRAIAEADEDLGYVTASKVDPRVLVALSETGFWLSRDRGQTFARHADLPAVANVHRRDITNLLENAAGEWLLTDLRECGSGGADCDGTIFLTADFGRTWQSTFEFAAASIKLAAFPADPRILYSLEKGGEVSRSSDGGHSFTQIGRIAPGVFRYFPIGLAVDPADPAKLWAIFEHGLHGSGDGGAHWTENARPLLADDGGREPLSVTALGGGNLLVQATLPDISDRRNLISRDGGAHWGFEAPGVQGGDFNLAAAASPGRYYGARAEGGLWRSDDRGRSWQELLPRHCVNRLAADPAVPATVYFSTTHCAGTSAQPRGLWRSHDAGLTFENISPPGIDQDLDLLLAVRQGNATALLTGGGYDGGRLWRSTDGGSSWQQVRVAENTVYELKADAGKIYATGFGSPKFSDDAGATWSELGGYPYFAVGGGKKAYQNGHEIVVQLPSGALVETPNPVYGNYGYALGVSLDRYGRLYLLGESIFRSLDDGRTWQNLESGAFGIHTVLADPFDRDLLLAETPGGPMLGRFPDNTSLVLGHGRFKVTMKWRAPDGLDGGGHGRILTDDSGGFFFFDPKRTEVVVKVLDGRPINGRFWVFVGSLTDVEFDLEVVDQVSGEKRSYHNDPASFASFGDSLAFPLGAAQPAADAAGPTFVYSDTTTFVPVSDHFEVDVAWQTADGSGVGKGSRLSEETAAFTFFSPENVELLVNVIDGRAINGHYWVFAGSLSNVAYTLRVRNRETGAVKEYRNPVGKFASFGDTSAF
jgi:photosystem II stability/assembly factor-like uncharacterized protein